MKNVKNTVFVSIYFDKRYKKANNKYPVKLRVFSSIDKKVKLYATKYELTEQEFEKINSKRPNVKFKNIKDDLQELVSYAQNIANTINPFNFDAFEKKLFNTPKIETLKAYYFNYIKMFENQLTVSTIEAYEKSLNSLLDFIKYKNLNPDKFKLIDITPTFLKEYENFMLNKGKSLTTISIYLRTLKSVFNKAISNDDTLKNYYPFGKHKYVIPATRKVKKALTKSELRLLFEATPQTKQQEKARDFWFFSYVCNGINIKDIALLKYKNIDNDTLTFYRAKTINSTRSNLTPITIPLNDFAKKIIQKYGKQYYTPETFIFDILNGTETPQEAHYKIKKFTRFVNQHIKKLAKSVGITSEISTYWARHSFATIAIREGATIELISEALGHTDIKTTQNYFDGFTSEVKKELSKKLLEF
jgi:site-specific recombinase XerD